MSEAAGGHEVLNLLRASFETAPDGAGTSTRTYYDTFDRCLAGADATLFTDGTRGERELRWEALSGGLLRRLVDAREPGFVADLPEGPFRAALEPLVGIRKLLVVARIRGRAERLRVLGKGGKTTVRVALEAWTIRRAGRKSGARHLTALRVVPVRGYGKPFRAVAKRLESDGGLAPLSGETFAELLGLRGLDDAPRSVWPPALQPGMRTDVAFKTIFRGLLETMRVNEPGTRARTDPEFLHEYRVALRRTRAGLARSRGVLPQRQIERFKREFGWLGVVTSPVRDIDVQLLDLPSYEKDLPASVRPHLAPLEPWLVEEGERVQALLVKALASARYARLLAAWERFLDRPVPATSTLPDATRPIEDVARERIWKLQTRVLRRGRAIDASTPAEAVHDLRLDAKKLRYLMEFFHRLFDPGEIKAQIGALKRLQDVLGRFNDFEVQQHALQQHATAMAEAERAPLASVLAIGRIVESLRARQQEARAEIEGRVAVFAGAESRARAEHLFAPRRQEQDA